MEITQPNRVLPDEILGLTLLSLPSPACNCEPGCEGAGGVSAAAAETPGQFYPQKCISGYA